MSASRSKENKRPCCLTIKIVRPGCSATNLKFLWDSNKEWSKVPWTHWISFCPADTQQLPHTTFSSKVWNVHVSTSSQWPVRNGSSLNPRPSSNGFPEPPQGFGINHSWEETSWSTGSILVRGNTSSIDHQMHCEQATIRNIYNYIYMHIRIYMYLYVCIHRYNLPKVYIYIFTSPSIR